MISLKNRVRQSELMDDSSVGFEEFATTLRQLESLNRWIGSYRPTLRALDFFLARHREASPLRILDVGSGHGDMLRKIHDWAKKRHVVVELTGLDLNPHAAQSAKSASLKYPSIRFLTQDVFDFVPEKKFHVIVNALFTHHLPEDSIVRLMAWMSANAELGWFINDLHRHPLPYHFIKHATRLLGYNRLIKNDAPLSVARSFVSGDWHRMAAAASLASGQLRISWHWPFRHGVRYEC